MRRRKWTIITLGSIAFLLIVSYKILEPDIIREVEKKDENTVLPTDEKVILVKELQNKYKLDFVYPLNESPWSVAEKLVTDREIHPEFAPALGPILHAMATKKIISADTGYRGTQLKLSLILEDGQMVVFKPRWYTREEIFTETPYSGADRHNGEIAAFHLNRILEFRRSPLSMGRKINLRREVMPIATKQLLNTFYIKGTNTCFYGKCYYCKGEDTGVCAEGDILEGTILLWLPKKYKLKTYKHPWARTYVEGKKAQWEMDPNYCSYVRKLPVYESGSRLLDLIDTAIFDFLIGNADRHRYETLGNFPNSTFLILDNGKSFGNPEHDEVSILAPLHQCCMIRQRTYEKLLTLQDGVLSQVLRFVLKQDPISPILTENHLHALDRRLILILKCVQMCIDKLLRKNVVVRDGL